MFKGSARCKIKEIEAHGITAHIPDLPEGVMFKRGPKGLVYPTPDATEPECQVEIWTETDRLEDLEAYAGVLYIFEYGEANA